MKPLALKPILSQLNEAHRELRRLFTEVDAEPFTEEVFGRRLHRIYREIETSWTYRKWRSKQ